MAKNRQNTCNIYEESHKQLLMKVLVENIMTYKIVSISPDADLKKAAKIMRTYDIGCLIALRKGKVAGIITERDMVDFLALSKKKAIDVKVAAVMTKKVITVRSSATIEEAVYLMVKHKIKKLPVVDRGKLVGIVTQTDMIETIKRIVPTK